MSFHFPFVPLSCFFHFLSFSSVFTSFSCRFLSILFICFHVPWISLGNVIWEKPRKQMETAMSPRFSAPDSIQLTFLLGGGLVLEILFFLSFFHLCLGALFLFIFQTSNHIQSCFFTVSASAGSARMFISFHFHSCCFVSLQFYCRLDRVPRSFPSSFIGLSCSFHFLSFSCHFLSFSFHVFSFPCFPFISFHAFSFSFNFLACFFHFLWFSFHFLMCSFNFLSFSFRFPLIFLSFLSCLFLSCLFIFLPFPFMFLSFPFIFLRFPSFSFHFLSCFFHFCFPFISAFLSFPFIFFRFPFILFRFLFISFHFPFVPVSCFFHFLSFP